jgi:hypothetical protein
MLHLELAESTEASRSYRKCLFSSLHQAYEKCFQNLHYMERYEDHTIAHAIQAKYEKTKVNMRKYQISLALVNPAVLTLGA